MWAHGLQRPRGRSEISLSALRSYQVGIQDKKKECPVKRLSQITQFKK